MSAVTGTLLFLGGIGIVQGVAVSPAAAAPVPSAVLATSGSVGVGAGDRDYRQGYRDGYRDGWQAAEDDCTEPMRGAAGLRARNSDYEQGYDRGFARGFRAGFREYC
ncbi:hypothetical protein GCM10010168_47020 [Actinoplanes ianthinogenes]|uniref:Lectin-like protein BA14k n=2 Tax=Actinoplanes ianthinogenes TaxID=122358 RepID=A0ABM7LNZ9_9ACTN|nr:hypothetical protein Aiant_16560 [Actinoplanes ianthinogenes]GGR23623.1 hypothetical protein GCM10010168_47020 [Actinoplanes ianthinogenes]